MSIRLTLNILKVIYYRHITIKIIQKVWEKKAGSQQQLWKVRSSREGRETRPVTQPSPALAWPFCFLSTAWYLIPSWLSWMLVLYMLPHTFTHPVLNLNWKQIKNWQSHLTQNTHSTCRTQTVCVTCILCVHTEHHPALFALPQTNTLNTQQW